MLNTRFTLAALAALGTVAAAQVATVKLTLAQALVQTTTVDGKTSEKLTAEPATVYPGDVLVQEVTATNTGKAAARSTAVTVPVPQGTTYAGRSTAAGARWAVTYSADNATNFAAAPLKRKVTVTENGRSVTKDVVIPENQYTHVRWTVNTINPDESLKFSFRVRVK